MEKRISIIFLILSIFSVPAYLSAGSAKDYLSVVDSDSEGLIMELWVPEPEIDEVWEGETLYHRITIPGFGATADVGSPRLPQIGTILGVPQNGTPTIEILETDSNTLSGYNVLPSPKPVIIEEEQFRRIGYEFVLDKEVYRSDGFIPSSVAEIGSTGFMRDQRIVRVKLFPLQFNPATGEVIYYSRVLVKFHYNTQGGEERALSLGRGHPVKLKDNPYEKLLRGVLLNYDEIRKTTYE